MKYINRFLFTLASLSYFWTVFLIVQDTDVIKKFHFIIKSNFIKNNSCLLSKLLFLLLPFIMSLLTIFLAHLFNKERIESKITSVEEISIDFIPTYIGYFFVALSFSEKNKIVNVVLIFSILFVFTLVGSKHLFNPLFYFFRYKLYKVKTEDGFESVIYSRKDISIGDSLKTFNIHRINNFTYILYKK